MNQLFSTIPSLQASADVDFIGSNLRRRAGTQLIAATVFLAQGMIAYPRTGSVALIVTAIVLGVEAVWLLLSRSAAPILAAAALLLLNAIWYAYLILAGYLSYLVWAIVAMVLSGREYLLYRKLRRALTVQTPESQQEFASIAERFCSPDDDALHPHVDGDRWTGLLFSNGLALRGVKGEILFLARDSAQIEQRGTSMIGGFQRLTIVGNGRKFSCSVTPEEAQRLRAWSSGAAASTVSTT